MSQQAKLHNIPPFVSAEPGALVDHLGHILANIAELKELAEGVKAILIHQGMSPVEGDLFRATVTESTRKTTDWRAIAEKLGPSRQLVAAHTKAKTSTTVRVVSRKTS